MEKVNGVLVLNHPQLQLQKHLQIVVKKQAHQKMVEVTKHFFQVQVKLSQLALYSQEYLSYQEPSS